MDLSDVEYIIPEDASDLNIMNGGGCYWIWTDEPVKHSLHKHRTPNSFENGEVIYNGIAKDNVKGRILNHLFGLEDAGWSAISLDIYTKNSVSHRKKACSAKGKVPYLSNLPIKTRDQLLKLHLSEVEKVYIKSTDLNIYFFRNGINIMDYKHKNYKFRVYYITGLSSSYMDFIEKEWREKYGLPKLCSYSKGR